MNTVLPAPTVHHKPRTARWQSLWRAWPLFGSWVVMLILAQPLMRRDFWYDESLTGVMSQWSMWDIINWSLQPTYNHPPLYPLLVKLGAGPFGFTPLAIRGISLAATLVGLIGVYLLAKKLFNRTTAGWACLVTATSPFVLQYATEARSYAVASAIVIFAAIFLVRSAQGNRWRDHILWGIFSALALFTHYTTLLFLPAFLLTYFLSITDGEKPFDFTRRWKLLRSRWPKLQGTALAACATFSFWLVPFLTQLGNRSNSWISRASIVETGKILQIFLFGSVPGRLGTPPPIAFQHPFLTEIVPYLLPTLLVGVATWLAARAAARRNAAVRIIVLTFVPIVTAYACSLADIRLFLSRFLYPAALFMAILLGAWIAQLRWRSRLVVMGVFWALLAARQPTFLPTGFSVFARTQPSTQSVLCLLNPFNYSVARYYFPNNRLALYNAADPGYDFTGWETVGPHRTIINVAQLFKDPNLLIVVDENLRPPDSSLPWSEMETVGTFDNLTVYRVRAPAPQP